jgi:hypothetical protein
MSKIRSTELGNSTRPIIAIRWAVRLGLIAALVYALAATAAQFEISRNCHGAFSRAFSSAFDRYRCDLVVRHIGTDFQITVPGN